MFQCVVIGMGNVTLTSIARELGVSYPTVSAVLTGRGGNTRVSRALAERIRTTARAVGYRPNAAARAIVTGRFQTVTAVVSADRTFRSNLNPHLLLGLTSALEARRLHLSITAAHDSQLADPAYAPHTLSEHCADGLLVLVNIGVSARMAALITRTRLPVVWVNDKRECDAVYPDDDAAGRQAAELLLAAGHRRLAYVDYQTTSEDAVQHYSRADRRAGFTAAVRAAGAQPLALPAGVSHFDFDGQRAAWRAWLQQPDRPTAVAAYSPTKLWALVAALDGLAMRVPRDLSVVVFHDEPVLYPYPLTTLLVPHQSVGQAAVEMLTERIGNSAAACPARAIPFTVGPTVSIAEPERK